MMKQKKKLGIIIAGIVMIALLVAIGLLVSARGQDAKMQEHLDLGAQYLDELDYEKAIAEYMAVLVIDPKCVDAYLGIVDAYVGMGDYENALLKAQEGYDETGDERLAKKVEEIEALRVAEAEPPVTESRIDENDIVNVEEIIWASESEKTREMESVDEVTIEMLEKVPDSSVSYVAVDGHGNPEGMGVHFQNYVVGVSANPIEGYRYARCESDTIEFYEYVYNEWLGYEVPWFAVPESGNHIIYVYYEPITASGSGAEQENIPAVTPEQTEEPVQLLEGTKALEIVVAEDVEVMASNGGVIITKKNDLYGAMNYAGEELVPNIYNNYYEMPNEEGYFALAYEKVVYETEDYQSFGHEAHVFDATGQEKLVVDNINSLVLYREKVFYTTFISNYEADICSQSISLYDMSKDVILYTVEKDNSDWYTFVPIVSEDGKFFYSDDESNFYRIHVNETGSSSITEIERLKDWDIYSNFVDGYAMANMIGTEEYRLTNEDGTTSFLYGGYDFFGNDYSYFSNMRYCDNGLWKNNKGKLIIMTHSSFGEEKKYYHLLNMEYAQYDEWQMKNTDEVIVATYDYISLSDSPYYLACSSDKYFYIDETGQIVHDSFLDYSAFYGGYAMIIDTDGCAYMIDEEFNKVAGGYEADSVATIGGIFQITKGDKTIYLSPLTE